MGRSAVESKSVWVLLEGCTDVSVEQEPDASVDCGMGAS